MRATSSPICCSWFDNPKWMDELAEWVAEWVAKFYGAMREYYVTVTSGS
ncbi:hypothetical protein [Enhygromyxa salina]|nr:hypothetical protein [Enhygromyxa salina]